MKSSALVIRAEKKNVPWHETLRRTVGGYDIVCFHCKWNNTAMRYVIFILT